MPAPAAAAVLARNCRCADAAELLDRLTAARRVVAGAWHDVFGETLEMTT
jgi:hypothetical protein